MKASSRRLLWLPALPLLSVLWAPGCAKQAEGDRCDFNRNGHQDCETPLVCVPAAELIDNSTDRCCPPEDQTPTDDRCLRSTGVGGTGGTGGTGGSDSGTDAKTDASGGAAGGGGTGGGTGGSAGSGGSGGGDAGIACSYSSQCPGNLVCGPTGHCQLECLGDKDCKNGSTCDLASNTCVPPVSEAGTD